MSGIGLEVFLTFLLVIANCVFSMVEMAVVSARKARLRQRPEEGSKGAVVALELAENPNDFLSTVQVGITMIGGWRVHSAVKLLLGSLQST
jgi:putative hemolysin